MIKIAIEQNTDINANLTVTHEAKKNPLMIVVGVTDKSTKLDQNLFITSFLENSEIKKALDEDEALKAINRESLIKVKFVRNTKREGIRNVVIEVDPKLRRLIKSNGDYVYINWCQRRKIDDFSPMISCYKCCGHGHWTKHCREANDSCLHCGEDHMFKACPSRNNREAANCVNCSKYNKNLPPGVNKIATNHQATYSKCPQYIKVQNIVHSRIDYG